MAKADIQMPEKFLKSIQRLGSEEDRIAESVLEAGAEVVESNVRSRLSGVIGSGTKLPSRSTGQLLASLGVSSVKLDHSGNHNIKVGFAEPRSDGRTKAKIANIPESGRHGQPAKPFLKPAKTASKSACIEAMQQKFEEEVEKL